MLVLSVCIGIPRGALTSALALARRVVEEQEKRVTDARLHGGYGVQHVRRVDCRLPRLSREDLRTRNARTCHRGTRPYVLEAATPRN